MGLLGKSSAFYASFGFLGRRFFVVAGLSLVAAGARYAQIGPLEGQAPIAQVALEVLVLAARLGLALAVVGRGDPMRGWATARRLLRLPKEERDARFASLGRYARREWKSLALDVAAYAALAVALNLWIAQVGELERALLLKNLSVIPFTIVFQVMFAKRLWRGGLSSSDGAAASPRRRG